MPRCDDLQSSLDRILKMGDGGLVGSDGVMRLDGIVDGVMFGTNFTNPLGKAVGGWAKKHHQGAKALQGLNKKRIMAGKGDGLMKLAIQLGKGCGAGAIIDES
jgi:hypothetical protein